MATLFARRALLPLVCGCLLAVAAAAQADVYHVSSTGLDTNDGLTWATAKKTIGAAITACPAGSEIWVAGGPAYVEQITLKSGVGLYGGFAGTEAARTERNPAANPTIIDANAAAAAVTAVKASASTVIDGFTIRNSATSGINSDTSSLVISNNIVTNHTGVGIYLSAGSPTIANNQILSNGSGVDCFKRTKATLTGNVIRYNQKWGLRSHESAVIITANAIRENGQSGIVCESNAPIIARRNLIAYNSTTLDGGGILLAGGTPIVESNTILGNSAVKKGGAIDSNNARASIRSNIIAWNTASEGGGIHIDSLATATIANNTIVFNSAWVRTAGGGITVGLPLAALAPTITIANNIVADNATGINRLDGAAAPVLTNNCVWNNAGYNYQGLSAGAGDLSADPRLASNAVGDYHLAAGSPCLDAGDDSQVVAGARDFDNEARIAGAHVEIGADEYVAGRALSGLRRRLCVRVDGSDAADGTSWIKAKATLAGAMDVAHAGDTVWVAKGTYADAEFALGAGVQVLGGFAGNETAESQRDPAANPAVIRTNAASLGITSEHTGATAVLDGLTIEGGGDHAIHLVTSAAAIRNCIVQNGHLNGIHCQNASPTIRDCVIQDNGGLGIYGITGSDPLVTGCTIAFNRDGGISLATKAAIIQDCTIEMNSVASGGGGGIYVSGGAPTIQHCIIRRNAVTIGGGRGGGVLIYSSNARLFSNLIVNNSSIKAAGIKVEQSSSPLIVNNTIASNTPKSPTEAGGIEVGDGASPTIANNILAFNVGHGVMKTGTTGTPVLETNCVFGNTGDAYKNLAAGTGDIAVDPLFRDGAGGDFHLKAISPCVNAGSDSYVAVGALDVDRQGRIYGAHVDIGADEARPFGMVDFNGDDFWDAVASNPTTGDIALLLMNGQSITGSYSLTPKLPAGWLIAGTGDFLGDGATSLVAQNLSTQQVSVLRISGKYIVGSTPITPALPPDWQVRCTGDFNGDNMPDLVVQNTSTRQVAILIVQGLKVTLSRSVNPTLPAGWQAMASADLDGNGTSDILVQNATTQQVAVLYMNGTTLLSSVSITPNLLPGWSIVGVSDINRDGKSDVLVQNGATRQISALQVTGNKFTGSLSITPTLPAGWTLVGPR